MDRKRLVFLANSFHLGKTRSSDFFIELLRRHFDVTVVGHKRAWLEVSGKRFDILVSWQHLYRPRELEAFGVSKVVLVPMYDDCPKEPEFWKGYRQFAVISFCKALSSILNAAGVPNLRALYYPPIPNQTVQAKVPEGIHAFFWQRTPEITWEKTIKPLFGSLRPAKMFFHAAPDPGFGTFLPDSKDMAEYNISISTWFDKPQDMQEIWQSCNLYFAPRLFEGIGMSFLEALSRGLCVVAPNYPTMNEYVTQGVDGILYDPGCLEPIDGQLGQRLGQLQKIGTEARTRARTGRETWELQEQSIVDFVSEAHQHRLTSRKLRRSFLRVGAFVVDVGRNVKQLCRTGVL